MICPLLVERTSSESQVEVTPVKKRLFGWLTTGKGEDGYKHNQVEDEARN